MGRRTGTETIAKLFVAFLQQATWSQKDLERRCDIGVRAVRKALLDLQDAGVPLEREEDPPHVYWSVPRDWPAPGARLGALEGLESDTVARLIARLPRSREREAVLAKLMPPVLGRSTPATHSNTAEERVREAVFRALEQGLRDRVALTMGYFSAVSGRDSLRTVSVQHLAYGDRPRFVAHCHTTDSLRWFRADRVHSAKLEPGAAYRAVEAAVLEPFVAESMDGFRGGGEAVTCEVVIRAAEARWALSHMPYEPKSAVVTAGPEGSRVLLRTAGLEVLARYLVGLGAAARVVSPPELRERVVELAREALASNGIDERGAEPSVPQEARLNGGPVRPIRRARQGGIGQRGVGEGE
ncbi:MAG TPA: WYL domain-containing protein [Polyangiaceae bacterium]|nr:WYL domain-containing protein [Polyangiaceae bacterium]